MNISYYQLFPCGVIGQKVTTIEYAPYVYVREFLCLSQDRNKEEEKAAPTTLAAAAKQAERI